MVMADAYRRQYGLNAICLLPVNLYGPRDNFDLEMSHVIPAMIRKFLEASVARRQGGRAVGRWQPDARVPVRRRLCRGPALGGAALRQQ